jgi:hypothetical protein
MAKTANTEDVPDLQYFNLSLYNSSPFPEIARLRDTRTVPILDNPEDFELSVVRFNIPIDNIPTSLVPLTNNPLIPAESILAVGIGYLGNVVYERINITPLNRPEEYPYPSGSIFTYAQMLTYVNEAFLIVFNQLVVLYPALTLTSPPVYAFNPATELFTVYMPDEYTPLTANPRPFTIHLNNALFSRYFCNMRAILTPGGIDGDWELITDDTTLNAVQPAPRYGLSPSLSVYPRPLYSITQDASCLERWNCFKNLLLTSSLVPIVPEYITGTAQIGQAQNANTQTGSLPIITDFLTLGNQNPLKDRSSVQYVPSAEYRMVSLVGNQALYNFDLAVLWVDIYGSSHPLFLSPLVGLDVKVMFRRKSHK